MSMSFKIVSGALALSLIAVPSLADRIVTYSSGTGFYVSRQGHVVTNAHVLHECKEITVQTNGDKPIEAHVIVSDEALDLALIQGKEWPDRVATLRHTDMVVQDGEDVMLIGYPETEGFLGRYAVNFSRVRSVSGLTGDSKWLQFEDSAHSGNSGGPLLDKSGNVIGVITGKAEIYRHNDISARDEVIDRSDVAISLSVLKPFLEAQKVPFEVRDSLMKLSNGQLEDRGQEFVVHVLCRE